MLGDDGLRFLHDERREPQSHLLSGGAALGNELLDDYFYLEAGAGQGGPIRVSLGNLQLSPGTRYVLYLFSSNGSANQRSAFTPLNNTGVTFSSLDASNGTLAVGFTTAATFDTSGGRTTF